MIINNAIIISVSLVATNDLKSIFQSLLFKT
jgi:hypothetical protein